MKQQAILLQELEDGALDLRINEVYGCAQAELSTHRARLVSLINTYGEAFGRESEVCLFSGPGRTEMGGNHTDHQCGRVLAAAVDLDTVACAGSNGTGIVRILSAGYPEMIVDLADLAPLEKEKETSSGLVRGIAARLVELGYTVGGFNACVDSTVLGGSGLSSSAAYEILIGVMFNHLFCEDALTAIELAQIGQYAENVYFGKPCGLMDQLASAVGGIVAIDFEDSKNPIVERLNYDLAHSGYALCIIDSGAGHADLTEEYAAIPAEMGAVANYFGKSVLREVDETEFWDNFSSLREKVGDRAVLRAIHFFADNLHALKEAQALERDDFMGFLRLVDQSGLSSAMMLQNLSCPAISMRQELNIASIAARHLLGKEGAVRVHGGGFAGTVQAYVPVDQIDVFRKGMEMLLHPGCCHFLRIRLTGGTVIA